MGRWSLAYSRLIIWLLGDQKLRQRFFGKRPTLPDPPHLTREQFDQMRATCPHPFTDFWGHCELCGGVGESKALENAQVKAHPTSRG
jgi:hypothetical protein